MKRRRRRENFVHIGAEQSHCVGGKVSAEREGPKSTRARMIDNAAESVSGIGDREAC